MEYIKITDSWVHPFNFSMEGPWKDSLGKKNWNFVAKMFLDLNKKIFNAEVNEWEGKLNYPYSPDYYYKYWIPVWDNPSHILTREPDSYTGIHFNGNIKFFSSNRTPWNY